MKVIIVEVTRAANTFGRTHLDKIREAYAGIAAIVAQAQASGLFRAEITPEFAALAFYGSIEQVLTGWIFDSEPVGEAELERAKTLIVETICRGLERSATGAAQSAASPARQSLIESSPDDGEPFGQAPDLVRPARRDRRARQRRVDARGGADLDARVRRRAARVTDQPPSQRASRRSRQGDTPAALEPDDAPTAVSSTGPAARSRAADGVRAPDGASTPATAPEPATAARAADAPRPQPPPLAASTAGGRSAVPRPCRRSPSSSARPSRGAVGAAFAGGLVLALILKRLAR